MQYLVECVKYLKEIEIKDKEGQNKIGNIINYITKSVPIDFLKHNKDKKTIEELIKETERFWNESNLH